MLLFCLPFLYLPSKDTQKAYLFFLPFLRHCLYFVVPLSCVFCLCFGLFYPLFSLLRLIDCKSSSAPVFCSSAVVLLLSVCFSFSLCVCVCVFYICSPLFCLSGQLTFCQSFFCLFLDPSSTPVPPFLLNFATNTGRRPVAQ